MSYRTSIALLVAPLVAAVVLGSCVPPGGCLMDSREHGLALWKVDVRSGQRQLVSAAWPTLPYAGYTTGYDLLAVDPARARAYLAYGSSVREPGLYALDLARDTLAPLLAAPGGGETSYYAVSPGGERVAFVRGRDEVWLAERDGTGARLLIKEADAVRLSGLRWLAGGRHLAYMKVESFQTLRERGGVRVVAIAEGTSVSRSSTPAGAYDITSDGSAVVYYVDTAPDPVIANHFVLVLEAAGLDAPDTLVQGRNPRFALGEQRIVYAATGAFEHEEVRSVRRDGTDDRPVAGPYGILDLIVSPDGRSALVVTQRTFELLDLASNRARTLVRDHDHGEARGRWEGLRPRIFDPVFDAEGTTLYYLVETEYWDDGCS